MKAANLFVKALENEGVEYIFGVPGEETLDLMDALSRSSQIKFILTRHEQTAAFMADVYGRLTGKAGVCLATLGPGATNLLTGIADAELDHAPVVAITGQAPQGRLYWRSHQNIDVVSMMKPVTKWNTRIPKAEIIPEAVRQAFKTAEAEKPGVAHLELPEDVGQEEVAEAILIKPQKVRRPAADYKAVRQAVEIIKQAKRPIILLGNGAVRKRAAKQLNLLLEKTGLPVANSYMAKGVVPSKYAGNLQTIGLRSQDYVACAFWEADAVIAVGYDIVEEYGPWIWTKGQPKKIIHIDFTPAEVVTAYTPAVEMVADIADSIWALNQALADYAITTAWSDYINKVKDKITDDLNTPWETSVPLKPGYILKQVREVLAAEDILISDVGAHKLWVARNYIAEAPNTCLISNGFASMGFALPGALTAKLVFPEKKVLAVCGDGGFMMNVQDLETAVRLKLPIVVLLWRDDGLGVIKWNQERHFGRSFGVDFGNPDFVKLAESFGARGYRVNKAEDLRLILDEAFKSTGPVIIDCPVDYSENLKLSSNLQNLECPI